MTNRLAENRCLHCGDDLIRTDGFPLCSQCEKKMRRQWEQKKRGEKTGGRKVSVRFGADKVGAKKMKERLGVPV